MASCAVDTCVRALQGVGGANLLHRARPHLTVVCIVELNGKPGVCAHGIYFMFQLHASSSSWASPMCIRPASRHPFRAVHFRGLLVFAVDTPRLEGTLDATIYLFQRARLYGTRFPPPSALFIFGRANWRHEVAGFYVPASSF